MPGKVSFFAIPGGTFQYGLKTIYVIVSLKIGVGVSLLPTTTRIERGTCAVVPDLEAVGRDVDEDVPGAQLTRQPPPALEIQLDLPNALLERNVQLGDHRRPTTPSGSSP